MPPRRSNRRTKPRRNRRKVVRSRRSPVHTHQIAHIAETFQAEDQLPKTAYEAEVALTQFPRAVDIADNFQEYRIRKLVFKYTPKYDTFSSTATTLVSLPHLYTKRMVYPAPATFGLTFLTALGAKPKRLDDKTVTISYVPNTYLITASLNTPQPGSKIYKSPWLSTHYQPITGAPLIDETPHYGHVSWITQDNPPAGYVCSLEVTAYFEFRKPWDLATSASSDAMPKRGIITPK